MPELSQDTIQLLKQALDKAGRPEGADALNTAMRIARDEAASLHIKADTLLVVLRAIIEDVPAVASAQTEGQRTQARQQLTEACIAAYYRRLDGAR